MPLRPSQSQTRVYGHRTVFSVTIIVAIAATIVAALFLAGLASKNVYAQSFQGGLRGEVRDTAAVIPGVTVTLMPRVTALYMSLP